MSNLPASRAESAGVLIAPEVIGQLGIAPTTGYRTLEPDQDQIGEFYLQTKTVAPSPISVERQQLAPQIVGASAMPKIGCDLTNDVLNIVGEGMMLARAKHAGGTGQSYFTPSARTATEYVVPGAGALPAGALVRANGWRNAANNGLFVVGAGSTANAIKVAAGVPETPSGYLATVEVAGYRGAAGALGINVDGNLIADNSIDLTTLGLLPGMAIYVGGVPGSAFAFGTAAVPGPGGVAEVVSVAPALVTLKRRQWASNLVDPGAGKTIDVYFTRWLRNVATTHPDWQEQAYHLELSLSSIGAAGAPKFIYARGMMVGSFDISAPLAQLVKTTINFIGKTVSDPTSDRTAGAAAAALPLLTDRFNTADKEPYVALLDATTGAPVATDVTSWKLTYDNGTTGQDQHGGVGAARLIVGKVACSLDLDLVITQDDAIRACTANTTLAFGSLLRSATGGVFINIPSLKLTGAAPKFPANGVVSIAPKGGAFIDAQGRYTLGLSVFAHLPGA